MLRHLSSRRVRALWLTVSSSRLIYVLLVDTALTFVVFTYLYHHHLTTLSNSNTIVNLCRSLRTATPTGLAPRFHSVCHGASSVLHAQPTRIQTFLSVTKQVVLGEGEGDGVGPGPMTSARNRNVMGFVALKLFGLVLFFALSFRARSSRRGGGGRGAHSDDRRTGAIMLERDAIDEPTTDARERHGSCGGESVAVLVLPETRASSAVDGRLSPPPAYSSRYEARSSGMSEEEEDEAEEDDDDDDEEDFPWIVLAMSLIFHLLVVLIDHGAVEKVSRQAVFGDKWAVIGCFLICTGVVGIWREMSSSGPTETIELHETKAVTTLGDEKRRMVVIEL